MSQTRSEMRSAHPISIPTSQGARDELASDEGPSWFTIGWIPVLGVSLGLFAWGLSLIFAGQAPGFLPALPSQWGGIDLVGIALVAAAGPYGIKAALDDRTQRRLEEQFPDFLTDLAANRRAGFTLAEAVRLAAQGDYGPLTPHVNRMAAQLSWNIPFEEALDRFADRVQTPLVTRSTTLVLEAERTGGYITDVLEAVARDAREIRRLERERRLSMRTYTMVMYVTFLVFLSVVLVLQTQLLPQLFQAAGSQTGGGFSRLVNTELTLADHRTFFYTSTLVQALGSGSMAGLMSRGRVEPGILHVAVMALAGVLAFSVFIG